MATRQQLKDLALLRLKEAEVLFDAGFFDGCAYLCGYVIELALKARICATLSLEGYSEKGSQRLRNTFETHDFEDLKLLAGMQTEFSADNPALLANWSIVNKWKPGRRYEAKGTYDKAAAEEMLNAIRDSKDGVLNACLNVGE
jgi:HEPN domain-containing protein